MSSQEIPFYPNPKPLVGHLPAFKKNRMGVVHDLIKAKEPIMAFKTPLTPLFMVTTPELVHEILVEKAKHFEKSAVTRFALYPLGGDGLFTSEGDLWKKQRKLMSPMFHKEKLHSYADDMVKCTLRTMETWGEAKDIRFNTETTRITMSVAGKTLFDADTFSESDEIGHALTVALDWANKNAPSALALLQLITREVLDMGAQMLGLGEHETHKEIYKRLNHPLAYFGKEDRALKEALTLLDNHVARMIAERRKNPGATQDLLQKLLDAQDEDDGSRMTDKQVRDEVLTLFVAGHETTSTGLGWAMYELCKNPELYKKAQEEVDALEGLPRFDDLPKLQLCLRIFKESLRMYPPVYLFGRQSHEEMEIGGYTIPKRAPIILSPYVVHHREDIWPDPYRFDPERFLPEQEALRHKSAWFPFSAGPRVCIGNHFAMMEAQLVLATLLQTYHFESLGEDEPDPTVTLRPKNGIPLKVTRRARLEK